MSNFVPGWRPFAILFALFTVIVSLLSAWDRKPEGGLNAAVSEPAPAGAPVPAAPSVRVAPDYGKLPISFEVNRGQTDGKVQFLARGAGFTLFLTPGEAVLSLHAAPPKSVIDGRPANPLSGPPPMSAESATVIPPSTVRFQLVGANTKAEVTGVYPLPGRSNYLIGNDPAKWPTNVPTYAKVRYTNVYSGIDLVYYGDQEGRIEHDFVVAPGADPSQIEFQVYDKDRTPSLKGGELTVRTKAGDLKLCAPLAYQVIGGERRPVGASYVAADSGKVRFRLGPHDSRYMLVIDPVLVYSAVFGGSGRDWVESVAIDSGRNVYVTGFTFSSDFPLANPYQSTPAVAFISKLNPSGTALIYSTYLGGIQSYGLAIAVDASGRAYVSGTTGPGFPVVNAYQPTNGGYTDAFITVLKPAGNALEWSTYLGGTSDDSAAAMALDRSGNVYLTGLTSNGSTFPELHSIPGAHCSGSCIWVAKFNGTGTLEYSTQYADGLSLAIAADSNGSAYISGLGFYGTPTTPGAFRSACIAGGCAFIAKLSPTGDNVVYATTLGPIPGRGEAIAVDSGLNVYVGGQMGPGLPVWSTGFQRTFRGGSLDGFVAKLNATGTNLIWSTYLGGSGDDFIQGLVLDQYRQVYVSGYTTSPDFPVKSPIQSYTGTSSAPYQYFVATLSPSLSSIQYYSTYFGSATYGDFGSGTYPAGAKIAVDQALNVYLACVDRNNVQPTRGAYSTGSTGISISKLVITDDLSLALHASPSPVAHGSNLTYTIGVTSKGPDFGVNLRVSDTLPAGTIFVSYDAGAGACTAPPPGSPGTLNCTLPRLSKGATWTVNLTVKVNAAAGTTLSNTAATLSNMQDFVIGNNSATITTPVN